MSKMTWLKLKDGGYKLHERSNVTWCEMDISNDNTLTVLFREKIFKKTFPSHKAAINVSQIVADRLSIKSRLSKDDGVYNLPGNEWIINDC